MSAAGVSASVGTAGAGNTEPPASSLPDAVAAARREIGSLPKDGFNPHYSSHFTTLGALVEKTDPALERHGLRWLTKPVTLENQPALYYRLLHQPSGEDEDGTMLLPGVEHMQGFGSAISYARRYALQTVLNLVGDDDDDGNASVSQAPPKAADTVDLTAQAKGLSDDAINAAMTRAGLQPIEKPWRVMMRVPEEYADKIREGLEAAHAAEGR